MFLVFMLVGTLFHYHFAAAASTRRVVLGCVALLAMGALCWRLGPDAANFARKSVNYAYALALFALCYALRAWFRPTRLLDLAAAVSYPLYLVHSLVGFSLMTYAILAWHVPYAVAVLGAFAAALALAWALHRTVERASIAAGRQLARLAASSVTLGPIHDVRAAAVQLEAVDGPR
jgi:peptidoglycan/LPS O-acetylase OafA/YrhL